MKNYIYLLTFVLITTNTACTSTEKNKISAYLNQNDLIFRLPVKDFEVVYYEINSLEEYRDDGMSYKNILKKEDSQNLVKNIIIKEYNSKNIYAHKAYYLNIVKRGNIFHTTGFCIKNTKVQIQKKNQNDKDFVLDCHKNS